MNAAEISKEKVLFLLDALNNEDYENAKECLSADFKYEDPLDEIIGANNFLRKMEKENIRYCLINLFEKSEEICIIYKLEMQLGVAAIACGLFKINNDKLSSLYVIFDPRTILFYL